MAQCLARLGTVRLDERLAQRGRHHALLGLRHIRKRELNCTFPGAVASTRLGCATGMASGEDERGVV